MLGARLRAIAHKVSKGLKVADIGSDHGLVPIYLIRHNIAKKVIATDISPGSLEKAIKTVKKEGLEDRIDLRLGSGLDVIKVDDEVDIIIIAGMGGDLISKILRDNPLIARDAKKLILQPMSNQRELRRWLVESGYKITDESLIKEDRYIYEIIEASLGKQEILKDIQYDIGFKFMEKGDPLFKEFIMMKIEKTQRIVENLKRAGTPNAMGALESFEKELSEYEEAYKWFVR